VVYARVSSIKQKRAGNLERQRDRLVNHAREQGYRVVDVIAEQASGINEKRRGLRRILEMSQAGKIDVVVCEGKDRLARFGFGYSYIEAFLTSYGVRVVSLEEVPGISSEEELPQDLITMITVLSTRLYGRRSHGFRKKVTDVIRTYHAQSEGGDAGGG
jgi:predicted site-specific integrase-resolvase